MSRWAFAGHEIAGKTIGIFGLGAVGALIAQAAGALGMHVVGYEPSPETIAKNRHLFPQDIKLVQAAEELYPLADYISLNVPLLPSTKGMINANTIALMKDGVVILNLARDAIVNDADIKVALANKKVHKYVTDFPNYASANIEGVIAIPHLGASTEEAEDNCAMMAARQLVDYLENGNITNAVNYPNLSLGPKNNAHRLIVLHENREGLANSIQQTVLARAAIVAAINKAKGEVGVTIIDFEKPQNNCKDNVCLHDQLTALPGVIRVRVIH